MTAPNARTAEPKVSMRRLGVRPIFYLIGMLLVPVGLLMLIPLLVELAHGSQEWEPFAIGSATALLSGAILSRWCRCELKAGLSIRQAFLLTPVSWLVIAFVGAIPLYLSDFGIVSGSVTDAFFESMSGLTTTGSTVITRLDVAPPGLLLWRALLQWIGGIGIIAVAIAVLPALGIGGMQLFRTESSDRSEKAMPRVRQIAKGIALVYLSLTVAAGLSYWAAGMTMFEAAAHALTTISTGGYSTSDNSLGNWNGNGIQWIAALFMLSGGVPFVLYVRFLAGERRALWDHQVKTLLSFLALVIVSLTAWLVLSGVYGPADAARFATFNTISVVTTTGYATTDYQLWGNVAVGVFFGLTFVGGCTGSTAGGIKIFRFEVMASLLRVQFLRLLYPNGVFPRTYAGKVLSDDVIGSVVVFFSIFFMCYSALTIALMGMNLDFATSASGAVTALANVGPGIGDVIGPAGNFSTVPDAAKWLLCFAMLLGRLELFTVLVLFMPRFWKG